METISASFMTLSDGCPIAKSCKMLKKPPEPWQKCYWQKWNIFSQKSDPSQEKSKVGFVSERTTISENTFLFIHWRFWGQGLQLSIFFSQSSKNGSMGWKLSTYNLSSFRIFPWEQQKRLKLEKIPVYRHLLTFQSSSRYPHIVCQQPFKILSLFKKKIAFCCFLRGRGKEKIIDV